MPVSFAPFLLNGGRCCLTRALLLCGVAPTFLALSRLSNHPTFSGSRAGLTPHECHERTAKFCCFAQHDSWHLLLLMAYEGNTQPARQQRQPSPRLQYTMQWLNSLDEAVDRVLVNNELESGEESGQSVGETVSIHSDSGPLHHESLTGLRTYISDISESRIRQVEEEESDHFVASRRSEQTAGQDSTSSVLPLVIEPDGSMLTEDDGIENDGKLPTFEPSGSSASLRPLAYDSIYHESEQPARLVMQEAEHKIVDKHNDSVPVYRTLEEAMEETVHTSNAETSQVGRDVDAKQKNQGTTGPSQNNKAENSQAVFRNASDHPNVQTDVSGSPKVSFEDEQGGDEAGVPTQVVGEDDDNFSEFNVSLPLPPWNSDIPLDPWLNCYGVVHVRLVCAQRLPCPVGSSVQGILALPPWKGRVRTERTVAFLGPELSGVCVRWDQLEDGGYCSMVNSWNSLDNPTPTISIDLVFHPLQMLEYAMCSVSLSCAPLMNEPGEWKKQWCQTTISQKTNDSEGFLKADERVPLILLEAMFVPAATIEDLPEASNENNHQEDDGEASSIGPPPSTDASLSPTVPNRYRGGSVATGASYLLSPRTKSHLLRVQSLWVPAACAVCNTVLVGWKSAYRCEACNIDCCKDCQLQVDLQVPCGSSIAKDAVAASFHNKLTVHNIMNAIAPWDASTQKVYSLPESRNSPKVLNLGSVEVNGIVANGASENDQGIGILRVHIARACVFENNLNPESNQDEVFKERNDRATRRGDYYVRLTSSGNEQSRRTRTIQNSGKPQFDSEELVFNV